MNKEKENELIETLSSCVNMQDVNVKEYFKDLKRLGKNIGKNQDFKKILDFSSAIGNEERLKIIQVLREKDRCVCELEVILDKSQPTISHHLRELERINLISSFKQGKFTHYDIVEEKFQKYLELLNKLLGKK
jgi:DNA-binding transcriptional ArsR family regulator